MLCLKNRVVALDTIGLTKGRIPDDVLPAIATDIPVDVRMAREYVL